MKTSHTLPGAGQFVILVLKGTSYIVYRWLATFLRCSTGFSLLVIWWCWRFGSHSVALLLSAFCSLPALKAQNIFLLRGLYIIELSSLMLVNITTLIWLRNVALILCQLLFFPKEGNECSEESLEERGSCLSLSETDRGHFHIAAMVPTAAPASICSHCLDLWTLVHLKRRVLIFPQVNPVALISSGPIMEAWMKRVSDVSALKSWTFNQFH